jgi:hypothetical protein
MVFQFVEAVSFLALWEEHEVEVLIYLRNVLVTWAYSALLTSRARGGGGRGETGQSSTYSNCPVTRARCWLSTLLHDAARIGT